METAAENKIANRFIFETPVITLRKHRLSPDFRSHVWLPKQLAAFFMPHVLEANSLAYRGLNVDT